ncbi:MAG: peptidylprolyl isomerase [Flavobacteriaceae bacterium]|nr:peptidylprolyl isomerase [Flavobacteriaceae bacterium]
MGLFFIVLSCSDDDDGSTVDDFDAAAQALIDDEKLVEYLQSHHYIPPQNGDVFGVIDTILAGESVTPLFDEVITEEITENDINYKLYYLVNNSGKNNTPTRADSVLVNYRGLLLDNTQFDERLSYTWLSLANVIRGWQYGFEFFKDGDNTTPPNEPLQFSDTGNGILFFPSGLGYGNFGTTGIDPNEPLLFFINLGLVVRADHDNDSILSIYEDVDNDGNVNNDDSDEDNVQNYFDIDDDGDGTLTRDENPDPNGDGNPDDALDTDGDGIPDYLDPDTN